MRHCSERNKRKVWRDTYGKRYIKGNVLDIIHNCVKASAMYAHATTVAQSVYGCGGAIKKGVAYKVGEPIEVVQISHSKLNTITVVK